MKKIIPLILLFACSNELRVYTDFDRDIEIHRLTTYGWLNAKAIESRNNPIYINELTDKRIKAAVEKQMGFKGYVKSEAFAQIIIHYHVIVEDKSLVSPEPFGYNYGKYWLENEIGTRRYQEGTLILDFMDSRNCDLIWRGWAVSILDDEKLISEELIDQAAEEIFQKFPVCAAKEALQY